MKKSCIILTVMMFSFTVFSQVQLTQYFLDELNYNPAYAGSKYAVCTNVYGRQQWLGFNDLINNKVGPSSVVYNLHSPVYSMHGGVGLNMIYDNIGFENNVGVKLDYSYRLFLNKNNSDFGIGIGLSLLNKTIDFEQMVLIEEADPLLKFNQKESGLFTDFDFGIYYQQIKKVYLGLSINNILNSSKYIGNINYTQNRNLYFTSSYYFKISNSPKSLYLVQGVFIKSNFLNAQIDLNTRLEYNNKFWGGISYRYQDAVAIFAGVNLNGFRIGASYDITIGNFSGISKGSPELFIGYCHPINPKVRLTNLYNTRYL